jgi:chaperonin cofactor prefoldin
MSDYVNELERRNEQLTSDTEKLAKELQEAKAKIYELENPPRASMRIRYTK